MLQRFVLLVMVASLLGCTTMQVAQSPTPQEIHDRLKVGNTVTVFVNGGMSYHLQITAIEAASLVGHDLELNKNWRIPYDRIEQIRYEKISGAKTTAAFTAGAVVTYFVIVAALVYAFSRMLSSAFN
ncbi:MAG: hypothetical protein ACRETW_04450 [Stenotrophobium sp.]